MFTHSTTLLWLAVTYFRYLTTDNTLWLDKKTKSEVSESKQSKIMWKVSKMKWYLLYLISSILFLNLLIHFVLWKRVLKSTVFI